MAKHRWNKECSHGSYAGAARGYLFMKLYRCTLCGQVSVIPPYAWTRNRGRVSVY